MKTRLFNDLKEAMIEKDTIRKNTIQSIRASILQEEKDNQIELTNKQIEDLIVKEKKKRIDALEKFKEAKRQDLIEQTEYELKILETYLPKQMSREKVEQKVNVIIHKINATSIKDLGKVMKQAREELGNSIDGKTLSDIVKEQLSK